MLNTRLPNLLIAGAPKSGTTSLHTYLSLHPEVCGSLTKELNFFSSSVSAEDTPSNAEYAMHFRHCGDERYILESTPTYLYGGVPLVSEISRRLGEDVRIIIILRDPVDRLISAYRHRVTKMRVAASTTWTEFIDKDNPESGHLAQGAYAKFLPDWFDEFEDRVLILFFEDLQASTRTVVEKICDWLDLDFGFYRPSHFTIENRTVDYRLANMHKFAMWLNSRTETFWRRHIRMKDHLRKIYYSLNERDKAITDEELFIKELEAFYADPKKELYQLLLGRNIQNMPAWLTQAP